MNLVGIKDIAQFLKAKESTLYSWAEKGLIPCYKLNGLLRFDMDEIREWLVKSKKVYCRPIRAARKVSPIQDIDAIIRKAIEGAR